MQWKGARLRFVSDPSIGVLPKAFLRIAIENGANLDIDDGVSSSGGSVWIRTHRRDWIS
jgi:hypothetical protein